MFTDLDEVPYRAIPRVLSVVGPADICNVWRTWWPSGLLGLKGFVADFCTYEEFTGRLPLIESGRYNMIVTPRIAFKDTEVFKRWRGMVGDMTWVYDADDDLFSPEFTDIQVALKDVLGLEYDEAEQQRIHRCWLLQRVNAVTVSTVPLAYALTQITRRSIYVQPNLINVQTFRYGLTLKPRIVEPLTVGWSGTLRGSEDLLPLARAWRTISLAYPEVQFVVQGYEADCLCSAVPASRLKIIPGVPVVEYPSALKNIDILCCSVADTPWNLRKSPIKWMEGSLAGAACVVSRALYGQVVEHGRNGLIADTDEDWFRHIASLISLPERRTSLNVAATLDVETQYSLEQHWREWVLVWANILDERARLNAGFSTNAKAAV